MGQTATTLLLLSLLLGVFCQEAAGLACCRRYSKREVPFTHIRGYSIQTIKRNCNIDAVIFHTGSGRNICADPSLEWVMNSVWRLREKVQALNLQKQQRRA
ncbi:C-C motif chemokine 20a.3 [Brachyhypopomus gauderio]|uniref:C-C motif chemokine 20a.3 n=1 Tax=Brachyhypopomus gauderio TaxID=698409 RepID=UPI004041C4C7